MKWLLHFAALLFGGLAGLVITQPENWEQVEIGFGFGAFGACIGLALNLAMLIPKFSPKKKLLMLLGAAVLVFLFFLAISLTSPKGEGADQLFWFSGTLLSAGIACYTATVFGLPAFWKAAIEKIDGNRSSP